MEAEHFYKNVNIFKYIIEIQLINYRILNE